MATPNEHRKARSDVRDLYAALTRLGEKMYLEALCLCDDEQHAAAFATVHLVRSLEEGRYLARIARAA